MRRNLLRAPHNLALLGALRAQIPTNNAGCVPLNHVKAKRRVLTFPLRPFCSLLLLLYYSQA